jgi:hypothetical protein
MVSRRKSMAGSTSVDGDRVHRPLRGGTGAGDAGPMMDLTTTVAHPWWHRAAAWTGLTGAGAGLGLLLELAVGWLAHLPWAPLQGPARMIESLPAPYATIGALALGTVAGLVLAGYVDQELLTVRLSSFGITLSRPGTAAVVVHRAAVSFLDRDQLVLLGPGGEELARQPCHLPARRLSAAFAAAGVPWVVEDPYADAYRRWVPGTAGLPVGANALFAARERAVQAGDTDDVAELREELARLGVVVRDTGRRQHWRLTSTVPS